MCIFLKSNIKVKVSIFKVYKLQRLQRYRVYKLVFPGFFFKTFFHEISYIDSLTVSARKQWEDDISVIIKCLIEV